MEFLMFSSLVQRRSTAFVLQTALTLTAIRFADLCAAQPIRRRQIGQTGKAHAERDNADRPTPSAVQQREPGGGRGGSSFAPSRGWMCCVCVPDEDAMPGRGYPTECQERESRDENFSQWQRQTEWRSNQIFLQARVVTADSIGSWSEHLLFPRVLYIICTGLAED
ncbi:hypothetical protein B0T20DRAFT_59799 [Sordaria brevicollis]|uniref:Uncharacterized protein n=1 Tax=Sordaria brevicollis TaxID=83679 RepID=A0AAE0P360_SORBR|nr:hypothetical protein B0T20DRAFT_59799 [Sordaria brevicollis]